MIDSDLRFEDQRIAAPVMLVIGSADDLGTTDVADHAAQEVHFAGFQDLTSSLLAEVAPDIVLSALLLDEFDAIDVATRLQDLGFSGRYRAVTSDLPEPKLIKREVALQAPKIDFDLLLLGALGNQTRH